MFNFEFYIISLLYYFRVRVANFAKSQFWQQVKFIVFMKLEFYVSTVKYAHYDVETLLQSFIGSEHGRKHDIIKKYTYLNFKCTIYFLIFFSSNCTFNQLSFKQLYFQAIVFRGIVISSNCIFEQLLFEQLYIRAIVFQAIEFQAIFHSSN